MTTTTSLDHSTTSPVQKGIWIAAGMMLAVIASLAFSQAWSADAAPGDDDATYVPIPSCRAFDFREGEPPAGGKKSPLGAGETYTQQITGAVGDCTIPNTAVGVAMNVTVANGTAQSNLRVFPGDVMTVPTVSNLNWLPGDSPTPNKVDVKLSPAGTINIYNQNGTVDVIGDIVGYYTSETLQELNQNVEHLLRSQPFAVSDHQNPVTGTFVDPTPKKVAEVKLEAPVDGKITVHSHAQVRQNDAGMEVRCSIELLQNSMTDGYEQRFEGTGPTTGSLAGTRSFDVPEGAVVAVFLVCMENGLGGTVFGRTLNATFTPATS